MTTMIIFVLGGEVGVEAYVSPLLGCLPVCL